MRQYPILTIHLTHSETVKHQNVQHHTVCKDNLKQQKISSLGIRAIKEKKYNADIPNQWN